MKFMSSFTHWSLITNYYNLWINDSMLSSFVKTETLNCSEIVMPFGFHMRLPNWYKSPICLIYLFIHYTKFVISIYGSMGIFYGGCMHMVCLDNKGLTTSSYRRHNLGHWNIFQRVLSWQNSKPPIISKVYKERQKGDEAACRLPMLLFCYTSLTI